VNLNNTPFMAWSLVGFSLCLLVPGTAQVQKYLGNTGVALYMPIAFSALLISYRSLLPRFLTRVTEKDAVWLAAITYVALIAVFAIVYPIADSGIVGGGSDRDDAIDVSTNALIRGRYPYYAKSYQGYPTHVLPGSLFLAIPFVLLGKSAYQNFLWLPVFFVVTKRYLGNWRLALPLLWAMLLLSPSVLHELVVGGDLISNSVYVLVFMLFMVNSVPDPNQSGWKKWLAAVLLGVGLSSRANFILLLPLVFSTLVQRAGWKSAIKYTAVTCVTLGGVTIPFFLYDPPGFFPFNALGIIAQFKPMLPFAGAVLPLLGGIIAVALSLRRMDSDDLVLLKSSAIVQAFLVVSAVALYTIHAGSLDLSRMGYGLLFLFFGGLACWVDLVPKVTMAAPANATGVPVHQIGIDSELRPMSQE